MSDFPAMVLSITVWAYWAYVGAMIVRVRRRTRKLSGIVPSQPLEMVMWLVWVPLVAAWATLPYLAATRPGSSWALPDLASRTPYVFVRWAAAAVGLICLAASIRCWQRMGRSWRMAVAPDQSTDLVTTGPYALVRHPIYALSMLLMVCTALVVPTPPVLAMAAVHLGLMVLKAHNEERFLKGVHGSAYESYCRRTGRFVPRFGAAGHLGRPH